MLYWLIMEFEHVTTLGNKSHETLVQAFEDLFFFSIFNLFIFIFILFFIYFYLFIATPL